MKPKECSGLWRRQLDRGRRAQEMRAIVFWLQTRELRMRCGCSSMVEPLPSKQMVRVRFSSPAPQLLFLVASRFGVQILLAVVCPASVPLALVLVLVHHDEDAPGAALEQP